MKTSSKNVLENGLTIKNVSSSNSYYLETFIVRDFYADTKLELATQSCDEAFEGQYHSCFFP